MLTKYIELGLLLEVEGAVKPNPSRVIASLKVTYLLALSWSASFVPCQSSALPSLCWSDCLKSSQSPLKSKEAIQYIREVQILS